MAKATITYTCKVCKKQTTESVTKFSRREADDWEAWASAHIDTCPACRRAAKMAEHEAKMDAEFAEFCAEIEEKPVRLKGTPKQVAWAKTIRRDCVVNAQRSYGDLDPAITIAAVNAKADASWWIDHRFMGAEELICQVLDDAAINA